jgi:hypothetical protein
MACTTGLVKPGPEPCVGQPQSTVVFAADHSPAPDSLSLSETRRTLQLLLDATVLAKTNRDLSSVPLQFGNPGRDHNISIELALNSFRSSEKYQSNLGYLDRKMTVASSNPNNRVESSVARKAVDQNYAVGVREADVVDVQGVNANTRPDSLTAPDCVSQTDSNHPYTAEVTHVIQRDGHDHRMLSNQTLGSRDRAGSVLDISADPTHEALTLPQILAPNRPEAEVSARVSHRLNEQKRRRVISSQVDALMRLVPVAREYTEKFGRRPDRATILECAAEHIRTLEADIASLKARIHELENPNVSAKICKMATSPVTELKTGHVSS